MKEQGKVGKRKSRKKEVMKKKVIRRKRRNKELMKEGKGGKNKEQK